MPDNHHPEQHGSEEHNPERRRFLRALGMGTAAAGVGVAIGHVTLAQADAPQQEPQDESLRYRESDHIRAYYATLRD
ncbi:MULTISPECIES: twin-arginine translocation signal domain-containing protein [Halomonadaceae]|uniref:twin-arginine translocation signal domain-containing protein n=1 Tax=Halomonadaceae TaxID=28256 RepID=UPI0015974815|nr:MULTISPECIES: twin-arginine translocation signal domain-containing protein [Halomonas]QJQ96616.1 twin-arginine translocation signal domain-containing protein [Halomonas sp. PA5]